MWGANPKLLEEMAQEIALRALAIGPPPHNVVSLKLVPHTLLISVEALDVKPGCCVMLHLISIECRLSEGMPTGRQQMLDCGILIRMISALHASGCCDSAHCPSRAASPLRLTRCHVSTAGGHAADSSSAGELLLECCVW